MPTLERAEIMAQLITGCSYQKRNDVEDDTCHICQEASLGPDGSEIPCKLRCGHVLGMACLTNWAFRQIEEVGNISPRCPFCRAPLLEPEKSTASAIRKRDEDELANILLPALLTWTPGGEEQYDQTERAETWIQRAEKLWDDICKEILDDLDVFYEAHSPGGAIEAFICGNAIMAERFLSFGNVFNFYQHFIHRGWRHI
ncbi:MAG: hypothetical protein Q9172_001008 [Xanthocarpia lactea]